MAWLVHERSRHEAEFLLVEHVIDQGDRTHNGHSHGSPTAEREHTVDKADLTNWIHRDRVDLRGDARLLAGEAAGQAAYLPLGQGKNTLPSRSTSNLTAAYPSGGA